MTVRSATRALVAALALLLGALAITVGTAGSAAAHATLVSTSPAEGEVLTSAPEEISLVFSEPVTLAPDGIAVFDATGAPVASEATSQDEEVVATFAAPEALPDGTYVLTWRVISADGHPVAGSLTFSIGAPSPSVATPEPSAGSPGVVRVLLSVATGLQYAGLLFATGIAFFCTVLLRRGTRVDVASRRLGALGRVAAGVGIVGALATLPLSLAYRSGTTLAGALDGDTWSTAAPIDLGGTAVLVVALGVLTLAMARGATRTDPVVAQVVSLVALAVPPLSGHTRAFGHETGILALDLLHLACAAVWLGGLVGLAVTLPSLAGRPRAAADLLSRFSTIAAGMLVALTATGLLMAWQIVLSWDNLVNTDYGRLLAAKVTIVAVVVAIAAWNRFDLVPEVTRATGHDDGRRAVTAIRRSVVAEAALLVAVVAVTGFLVNQTPRTTLPPVPPGRSGTEAAALGEVKLFATLTPGTPGRNTLLVQLQDSSGEPLEHPMAPTVRIGSDSLDLGEVPLSSADAGTFRGEVTLPTAGRWEVQVSQRLSEFDNPVAVVSFEVR